MIDVNIFMNKDGIVFGFQVENHGQSVVCAAVSMLVINTVNAIEAFTEEDFVCDVDPDGGFIKFTCASVESGVSGSDVLLLLNTLVLGLYKTLEEYPDEIMINNIISDKAVN